MSNSLTSPDASVSTSACTSLTFLFLKTVETSASSNYPRDAATLESREQLHELLGQLVSAIVSVDEGASTVGNCISKPV